MQSRTIAIHSATQGTSFQELTTALATTFREQGQRNAPGFWTGTGARQLCLVSSLDALVFDPDTDQVTSSPVVTQSWDELMAEVEAEMADQGPESHSQPPIGSEADSLPLFATDTNGDLVSILPLPLTDHLSEPSAGTIFVLVEERIESLPHGRSHLSWALRVTHDEREYRNLVREPASGELLELEACGLNVLGAVGRLRRAGLLDKAI